MLANLSYSTESLFTSFIAKHNKNYPTLEEFTARMNIFELNLNLIQTHEGSSQIGLNQFADQTEQEWAERLGNYTVPESRQFIEDDLSVSFPATMDWRMLGAVTPVMNQEYCNVDYAIAVVGAVEGMNFLLKNKLTPFSSQQVVDCSTISGNQGCS